MPIAGYVVEQTIRWIEGRTSFCRDSRGGGRKSPASGGDRVCKPIVACTSDSSWVEGDLEDKRSNGWATPIGEEMGLGEKRGMQSFLSCQVG